MRGNEKRWHIGRDGTVRECHAKDENCPLGGSMTGHFTDVGEAAKVADAFNERIVRDQIDFSESFEIANVEGRGYVKGKSETALETMRSFGIAIKQLERVESSFRDSLHLEMSRFGGPKMTTSYVTISYVSDGERSSINRDRMRDAGVFPQYSKESTVSEFLSEERDAGMKVRSHEKDLGNAVSQRDISSEIKFSIIETDENTYKLDEESEANLRKLMEFRNTLAEMKATKKRLELELMEGMKASGVNSIEMTNRRIVYKPEHTRRIADTKLMREDGIYEKFADKVKVNSHLRFRATGAPIERDEQAVSELPPKGG